MGAGAENPPTASLPTDDSGETLAEPDATQPILAPGKRLGRYVILRLIGTGGMGQVYAAYDADLDRQLALKVMHRADSSDRASSGRQRLLREAQAAARLNHPNIVALHDVGLVGDAVFIAMEFVVGQDLRQWQSTGRPPKEVIDVYRQAGAGLAAAHRAGLIHRDFKPANVLMGEDGRVRVLDFGLAVGVRSASGEALEAPDGSDSDISSDSLLNRALTRVGALIGTPRYMAPESLGGGSVSQASDQFAFCVALYEALYGEHPFPARTRKERYDRMVAGALKFPPRSKVPGATVALLRRGMALDPAQRYPNMDALLHDLARDPYRRRRMLWRLLLLGGLGSSVGGVVALDRYQTEAGCVQEGGAVAHVWNAERRARAAQAFSSSRVSFAGSTWRRASTLLDDYAANWAAASTAACRETRVLDERSPDLLARTEACLDRSLTQLNGLVEQLDQPSEAVVEGIVTSIYELPALDGCLDPAELARQPPSAPDPVIRRRVQDAYQQLGRVAALRSTGSLAEAQRLARAGLSEAESIGDDRLLAATLLGLAEVFKEQKLPHEAESTLIKTYEAAERSGDDRVALQAARLLVFVAGYLLAHNEDGERWYWLGALKADRLGLATDDPHLNGLNNVYGVLQDIQGNYEKALALYQKALAGYRARFGPKHPRLINTLGNLAIVYRLTGRFEEALQQLDLALSISRDAYGGEHPQVANALNNKGNVFNDMGRFEEALQSFRDATELLTKTRGPDNISVGFALLNASESQIALKNYEEALRLIARAKAIVRKSRGREHPNYAWAQQDKGTALLGLGRFDEAQKPFEEALKIRCAIPHPEHEVAESRFGLAQALWASKTERPRAIALARQALAEFEASDVRAAVQERARVLSWLGEHASTQSAR